jgi:superfamily II DNA or RNA helicase
MSLLPYQEAPCAHLTEILRVHGAALDASDTGVGKTYVAVHAAKRLELPVGIVCPKAVIPSWERVCASEGLEPAFILNYEKLVMGTTDVVSRSRRKFTWNFGGIVLFDEVDRCKSHTSLASRLLISAWESRLIRCHCMSATAAQNPMEMRALGFVLGLHNDYDFFKWVQEKGAKKNRWEQYVCAPTPEVMEELHHAIFPARGVRVRISDLGNAFPENQVVVENLAIAGIEEVNAAYAEAHELLAVLDAKAVHDSANAFTIILRARQRAELAKIPVLVEQAESLLQEGASVAIFVNFNDTLEAVAKHLNTDCVIRAQKADDRKRNLDAFQANQSKVIVCNTQAGGVGINLHDVHGGHRRVSLILPTYNARNLKQALGRIHRSGAKTPCVQKLIFAAGTVEDRIAASIRSKLQAIDRLNDNELDDGLSWYLNQL